MGEDANARRLRSAVTFEVLSVSFGATRKSTKLSRLANSIKNVTLQTLTPGADGKDLSMAGLLACPDSGPSRVGLRNGRDSGMFV